jgi:hypothetical protein
LNFVRVWICADRAAAGVGTEMLEAEEGDMAKVLFHFLSWNLVKGSHMAMDEELLQEIINKVKLAYDKDVENAQGRPSEEDYAIMYPKFMKVIGAKAEMYKQVGYRY